ncbi:YtxH domain-containing protein [Cellulomonas sp.]|uniref:YtxH domain-containing protein n=1 Tax=Cellulomonas sp. TaxID=40001 RepID=UPI0025883E67|nr:YtxH domain-containing protein [Cellulomonas sp.]MCR6688419.1 YtxH domain-containing protein [Cellulomonas sp.]
MSGRITAFVVGTGVGYLLGTRHGRELVAKARGKAGQVWQDPRVQSYVHDVEDQAKQFAKDQAVSLKDKAVGAARAAMSGTPATPPPPVPRTVVVEPDTPAP